MNAVESQYRYPAGALRFASNAGKDSQCGFFRFGGATLYGWHRRTQDADLLHQASAANGIVSLPFCLDEVTDNLRMERYQPDESEGLAASWTARQIYYGLRALLPIPVRRPIQRLRLRGWEKIPFPAWPVDTTIEDLLRSSLRLAVASLPSQTLPFIWFWPRRLRGCLVMTHDVEEQAGVDYCRHMMDLEERADIRAAYQFIPEDRYRLSEALIAEVQERGHEVNVHDLNHDGRLFESRRRYEERAPRIAVHVQRLGARGFRSAILYRRQEWLPELQGVAYDMSVPNSARLDPQRGGCCTVMPYWNGQLLEIPLTTTQDYSLFHILGARSLDLWQTQADKILEHSGLLCFNIHPDYVIASCLRGSAT